jgi:hypothetical protein
MEALRQRIERIEWYVAARMNRVAADQAGQGTAEYIGIIALVGAAIAALAGFGPEIAESIKNAIKSALDALSG